MARGGGNANPNPNPSTSGQPSSSTPPPPPPPGVPGGPTGNSGFSMSESSMQGLQSKAGDLQSRLTAISSGLRGLQLGGNALGPIGLFAVPALNNSNGKSVEQADNASKAMGNVQSGLKATQQTHVENDQVSRDQFAKIDPTTNARNTVGGPNSMGPGPKPPAGPVVMPPQQLKGGPNSLPGGPKPAGGPAVAQGPNIKGGPNSLPSTGTKGPGGPGVSQFAGVNGTNGATPTGPKGTGGPSVSQFGGVKGGSGPVIGVPGGGPVGVPMGKPGDIKGSTPGGPSGKSGGGVPGGVSPISTPPGGKSASLGAGPVSSAAPTTSSTPPGPRSISSALSGTPTPPVGAVPPAAPGAPGASANPDRSTKFANPSTSKGVFDAPKPPTGNGTITKAPTGSTPPLASKPTISTPDTPPSTGLPKPGSATPAGTPPISSPTLVGTTPPPANTSTAAKPPTPATSTAPPATTPPAPKPTINPPSATPPTSAAPTNTPPTSSPATNAPTQSPAVMTPQPSTPPVATTPPAAATAPPSTPSATTGGDRTARPSTPSGVFDAPKPPAGDGTVKSAPPATPVPPNAPPRPTTPPVAGPATTSAPQVTPPTPEPRTTAPTPGSPPAATPPAGRADGPWTSSPDVQAAPAVVPAQTSPQLPNAPHRPNRAAQPPATSAAPNASDAQVTMLNRQGVVPVPVPGSTPSDSFINAITATLQPNAPDINAQLQNDPNPSIQQIAEAAGARVHVLGPDGTFTSIGPITGVPVHVVERGTPHGPRYDGTKEEVHIGRPGISYPGPTTKVDGKGDRQTVHRGEYEVETIAGQHHVRVYTAVVNPATFNTSVPGKPTSPFKDVQQDPNTGDLSISPGANAQLWAGGGRPQRAVQWLAKYEHTDGGKPVSLGSADVKKPVLRSFLVPLDVFDQITRGATVEGAPGSSSQTSTYNVDQRGEPNQFGIGGPHLDALVQNATPGSLITYSSDPSPSFAHPELAGRVQPVTDLYQRLGMKAGFETDALGKENDPWFSWKKDKSGNWQFDGFNNNSQQLHDIATNLREHHVTWQQAQQNPADRRPDALVEPDSETAPGKPGDAPRDTSFPARFERLNQFLNSVGPPSVNVNKITTEVLSTAPDVLKSQLGTTGAPNVDTAALQNVVDTQVVPKSLNSAFRGMDKAIKDANGGKVPKTEAEFTEAVDKGFSTKKTKTPFDQAVVKPMVDSFVAQVRTQDGLQLLNDPSRADVAANLEGLVQQAIGAEFANVGQLRDIPGSPGKNASWLSGPRLAEFQQRVAQQLQGQLPPGTRVKIDPQRLGQVAQQQVLGPVVNQALGSFTGQDLVNTSPNQLKSVVDSQVLPQLSADIAKNLREHPALSLVDQNFRDSIADAVAEESTNQSKQALAEFTFAPVNPADVHRFMAQVPEIATQAEIGALIAADSDRIAIDFNTRPQDDPRGPFLNSYNQWKADAPAQYQAQRDAGDALSTSIDNVRTGDGKPDARPVVDQLIHDFPELKPKFDEVATKNQPGPYRAPGSKDGFTFYEHAQMVLGQYLDLTKSENPDTRFISTDAMAKAILFHDIEKNNAKNQFGDGKGHHDAEPEHKLAVQMMDRYEGLWQNTREFEAVRSIVDSDPFGFYLRNKITADEAFTFIRDLAERIGDPDPAVEGTPNPDNARKLFDEFHQYYQADFSSYTQHSGYTDAGGNVHSGPNAFNQHFQSGPDGIARTDDGRHYQYTPEAAQKMDELRAMFADPDTITANRDRIREADAQKQAAGLGVPQPANTPPVEAPSRTGTPETSWPGAPVPPPNAPGFGTPDTPSAPPATPSERANGGLGPELSLDLPPASSLDPQHTARIDALAADIAESNAMRDRNGYRPAVVEVSGPNAQVVADALAARGVDAPVRDTNGTSTDVHVDHDLRRPEGWTPPEAPKGAKVADTVITSPEPQGPHPVLDEPSWRHSTAPDAPWFDAAPDAATNADIREARTGAPITSSVRAEDGGVLDTTTIGPDGINMQAWRGPITYDTRVLDVGGVPVRDFTVKVFLDSSGNATPDQVADVQARTLQGVDSFFNNGNRLPSGEQFHVTVEFTGNPADAHGTVAVTGPDGRANQLNWPVGSDPAVLGHEVGHFLGLHDEYFERGDVKPIFQHQDGKGRVVRDSGPMTEDFDLADASVKPRNLWLVENRMHALESFTPQLAPAPVTPGAVPPATTTTEPSATPSPSTTPAANAGTQPPNAPLRNPFHSTAAPQPPHISAPIPMVDLGNHAGANPAPNPVLASRNLPDFFQHGKALGTIAPVEVRGAQHVTGVMTGITPDDAAVIESALENNFESFLGEGRNFQVKIGGTWFEANIKAQMLPPANDAAVTSTPPVTTKVDMTAQSGNTTSTTTNLTTANDVGLAAAASAGLGPYGSLGGKVQLATPATSLSTSSGTVDQRSIRAGESSTMVDVPVSFQVTLTSADGAVRGPQAVNGGVSLQMPNDLDTIANSGNAQPAVALPPGWDAELEHPTPEAVTDLDSTKAFKAVAAKMHPSITKIGSPGRTALQDFLSPTTIRDNLGAMLGGWVTSPDLISPHGSKGNAVQMKASLLTAELVGTHSSAQLRLHESQATGSSVSSTTKTGFDVAAGFGGGVGLPNVIGGTAGITGSYSARTSETSAAGTSSSTRTGIQLKGDTGLYKVTANVHVRTPNGADVVVPVTTYLRLGLPEAAALDLPVPPGTPIGLTTPGTAGTKFLPPYLDAELAAGNVKVGQFGPGAQVQTQVESTLKDLPGFGKFLPGWNDPDTGTRKGQSLADIAEANANQRKLDSELSPTALKTKMDSLLGPGVQVQLKKRGPRTNEYVNITVRARPVGTQHLGQVDARNVRGSASTAPKLDSTTATQKAVSIGIEGKAVFPAKTDVASLTPTPQAGVKYTYGWGTKNSAGPTVNSTALNVGSPNAQVFSQDLEFDVEITTFTRNRSWVKRMTPGSPFLQVPEPKLVAKTGGPNPPGAKSLDQISGPVHLWVSNSSSMDNDPSGFRPGTPESTKLDNPPTIKQLLNPPTPRPPAPEFLHVEAVVNTTALRDQVIESLNLAAKGDSSLTVPGTEARNQIDKLFSPESIKANLRKLTETGMQQNGLKYGRRVTDRTGAIGMAIELGNPRLVSIADDTGTENATTGGYKAGDAKSSSHAVDITGGINVPVKPNQVRPPAGQPTPATGAGGVALQGKVTPYSSSKTSANEISGSVDRNFVTPPSARTVLVQLDADVTVVGESRSGNAVYGGTPRVEGATVKLPGGVFLRVSEDVARELGVLPDVRPKTAPPSFGTMVAPPTLSPGNPSSLGLSTVDKAPDLSGMVTGLINDVNRQTSGPFKSDLVPDSVLEDSMNNFQRLVDLTSPTSVKSMIDSALDGGVPLLLHQPGTFGKDSYQVTLKARITGTPTFNGVVNDGVDMEHTIAGAQKVTDGQGRATGWGAGIKVPGTGQPGSANPNVSGGAGVIAAANVGQQHSSTVTKATTQQFSHLRAGSGPAAKYNVPIEFELVVERGNQVVSTAYSGSQDIGVRLHADNQKVSTPTATPPVGYAATTSTPPAAQGTPQAAAAWQQNGNPAALPPSASVENLRGARDLRAAAVQALTAAGANQGITGKGSGALNTLLSTLSSENLQPSLPGMLNGPLDVPGLHEAALLFGQHADVKVYAKLVNPGLGGLSDGVNLENPKSSVTTTSGEAKHSETGDVSVGWASGSASVKPNTNPKDTAGFNTGGIETRHATEDAEALSGGATNNKVNNLKAQGRTGLVEFDVEYRVVATVGGRTGVVDLNVPGSASVRMPSTEAETVLGRDFDADLSNAQTTVKDTAKAWRDAELAVDGARHDAQAVINRVAAEVALLQRDLTESQVQHNDAIGADLAESGRVPDLEHAVRDAQTARDTAGDTVKDLRRQVLGLDSANQDAQDALADADADVRTTGRDLASANTAVDTARGRFDAAQTALDTIQGNLDAHLDNRPEGAPPIAADPVAEDLAGKVDDARAARDARQTELDAAVDHANQAQAENTAAIEAQALAQQRADDAQTAVDTARDRLDQADQALTTARDNLQNAGTDLDNGRAATQRAVEARAAAQLAQARVENDIRNLEAEITAAEVELDNRRTEADARQQDWWNARIEVDQRIADYNRGPAGATPAPLPGTGPIPAITVTPSPAVTANTEQQARQEFTAATAELDAAQLRVDGAMGQLLLSQSANSTPPAAPGTGPHPTDQAPAAPPASPPPAPRSASPSADRLHADGGPLGQAVLNLGLPPNHLSALLTDATAITVAANRGNPDVDVQDVANVALTLHGSGRGTAEAVAQALVGHRGTRPAGGRAGAGGAAAGRAVR
jgi:hypothetical protein